MSKNSIPDVERFSQEILSKNAGLGASVQVSGQKLWKFRGIYHGAHTIIINEEQFLPPPEKPARVAVYSRVSSTENRTNLESQAERVIAFCIARGWVVSKVVKECGSGVNDQRPQFLALLADTSFTHIVVEHKDRCSRFGVAYIQTLLATQGRELVIVHQADTSQDDLMQDFAAIITSFTARLYGRRRASRKKQELIAALAAEDALLEPEA